MTYTSTLKSTHTKANKTKIVDQRPDIGEINSLTVNEFDFIEIHARLMV